MLNAWKFLLRRDLPPNSLKQVNFSVFGLGDSSYALFNAMAKKLTQRMLDLGANLFQKVGLGDAQHDFGYEGEFDPWLQELWPSLKLLLPPVHPMLVEAPSTSNLAPPVYKVQASQARANGAGFSALEHLPSPLGAFESHPKARLASMTKNTQLTPAGHFQDTRHLSLTFEPNSDGSGYKAGDILMVQPQNSRDQLVLPFLSLIGLAPETQLQIAIDPDQLGQVSATSLIQFPAGQPISALELFSFWLNLSEPPSRYFCEVMGTFLSQKANKSQEDVMKSEKLLHFASKTADGKSEYFGYCVRERRDVLTVFKDFGITNEVPLAYLIQGIGRQRPREYSISSSYRTDARGQAVVDLTMLVTEYETKFKRQVSGVCSGWLKSVAPKQGDPIPVWLKAGTMTFPEGKPLIMVGPGTGVAAFRAVIQ